MKALFTMLFCALALGTFARLSNLDETDLPEDEAELDIPDDIDPKELKELLAAYDESMRALAQNEASQDAKELIKSDAKPLVPLVLGAAHMGYSLLWRRRRRRGR